MKRQYEIVLINMDDKANNSLSGDTIDIRYTKHSAHKSLENILKRIIRKNEDVNSNVFYLAILEYTDDDNTGDFVYEAGLNYDYFAPCYSRLNDEHVWKERC